MNVRLLVCAICLTGCVFCLPAIAADLPASPLLKVLERFAAPDVPVLGAAEAPPIAAAASAHA